MCLKVSSSEIQRSMKKQKEPLNALHFHSKLSFAVQVLRFMKLLIHQQILDQVTQVYD